MKSYNINPAPISIDLTVPEASIFLKMHVTYIKEVLRGPATCAFLNLAGDDIRTPTFWVS
jgi:hypothetical protein